jgi:hypothetical protein
MTSVLFMFTKQSNQATKKLALKPSEKQLIGLWDEMVRLTLTGDFGSRTFYSGLPEENSVLRNSLACQRGIETNHSVFRIGDDQMMIRIGSRDFTQK